jgi:hypothetical protein
VLTDANQRITIESLQSQFAGQTEKKAVIGFVTEKGIAMLILGWHYWRIQMAKRPKATF